MKKKITPPREITQPHGLVFGFDRKTDEKSLKLWEGLGYYSRARNMLEAARTILERHGGNFPDTYDGIRALKGVGPYTAAAIASFAFGLPHAVVDGNVFRVLARLFGIDLPIDICEQAWH